MKRISDEDVGHAIGLGCPATLEDVFDGEDMMSMLVEVQQRRAADLTPNEVAAMRDLLASLDGEPSAMRSALEKVIAANGAAS